MRAKTDVVSYHIVNDVAAKCYDVLRYTCVVYAYHCVSHTKHDGFMLTKWRFYIVQSCILTSDIYVPVRL